MQTENMSGQGREGTKGVPRGPVPLLLGQPLSKAVQWNWDGSAPEGSLPHGGTEASASEAVQRPGPDGMGGAFGEPPGPGSAAQQRRGWAGGVAAGSAGGGTGSGPAVPQSGAGAPRPPAAPRLPWRHVPGHITLPAGGAGAEARPPRAPSGWVMGGATVRIGSWRSEGPRLAGAAGGGGTEGRGQFSLAAERPSGARPFRADGSGGGGTGGKRRRRRRRKKEKEEEEESRWERPAPPPPP